MSELLDYFHLEEGRTTERNVRQAELDLFQFYFFIFSFSFGFQIHERLNHDNDTSTDYHQELNPGTYSSLQYTIIRSSVLELLHLKDHLEGRAFT